MKKTKLYRYLGKNGIVTTPIELIGIEPIKMWKLDADKDKVLTNGEHFSTSVQIFAEELDQWQEVGQDEVNQNN